MDFAGTFKKGKKDSSQKSTSSDRGGGKLVGGGTKSSVFSPGPYGELIGKGGNLLHSIFVIMLSE